MKPIVKEYTAFSDAGKRPHNEDFVYPSDVQDANTPNVNNLYIVCDGIGGLGKGNVASRLVCQYFAKFIEERPSVTPITQTYINQGLKFVENGFDDYIKQHPDCWGMGATVAILYLDEFGANIAWAGNCRVYQFRGNKIVYKTEDHTEAALLLREGRITETEALTHIRRFPLRAIQGSSYPTQMEYYFIPKAEIEANDIFYLCSDGIQEAVKDSELSTILTHGDNAKIMNQEIKALCEISSGDNYASCIVKMGDSENNASHSIALQPTVQVEEPAFSVENEPVVDASPTLDLLVSEPSIEVTTPNTDISPVVEMSPVLETDIQEPELSTSFSSELPSVDPPSRELPNVEAPSMEITQPVVTPPIVTPPVVEIPPVVTPPPRRIIIDESVSGTRPNVTPPPPPVPSESSSSMLPLLVLGLVAVLVLVFTMIWWSGKSSGKSYEQYYELAKHSAEQQNYDRSIAYLDSALRSSGDNSDNIRKINLMKNDVLELKRQADKQKVMAEAAQFSSFGKYTDYLQAMKRYKEVIQNYGDNGGIIQKKMDSLILKMNKIDMNKAYQDLYVGAEQLCKQGNGLDAELYITEARKLRIPSEKLKELNTLSTGCAAMAQNGNTGEVVADNATREVDVTTNPSTSTDKSASKNAATVPSSTKSATVGVVKPNSSSQVVETNKTNARINKPSAASANWEKLPPLEKGKAQFDAKKYDKAKENLETAKSLNKWDGEAAYQLSYIYHMGLGGEKNAAKALENAKYSSDKQYPSGLYLYATMLLNNKKHNDSIKAKGKLVEAADLKQKEATALLGKLDAKKKK